MVIIRRLYNLVDKASNWQHMELVKSVFKMIGKLTFKLTFLKLTH